MTIHVPRGYSTFKSTMAISHRLISPPLATLAPGIQLVEVDDAASWRRSFAHDSKYVDTGRPDQPGNVRQFCAEHTSTSALDIENPRFLSTSERLKWTACQCSVILLNGGPFGRAFLHVFYIRSNSLFLIMCCTVQFVCLFAWHSALHI